MADEAMTALGYLPETPSQTAGPYVHIGLIPRQAGLEAFANPLGEAMVAEGTAGERIRIEGRVLDGLGEPCREVLLEIWQADARGRYGGLGFRGWGRAGTDFATGVYAFETIKPGAVAGRPGHRAMAPHVNVWLVSRGINIGLATRMYFADEAAANAEDAVLQMLEPWRRATLLARREERDGVAAYVFDIRLQGEGETVFFDA